MKKVMCLVVAMISVFVYGFAFAASPNPTVTVVNPPSNPVQVTGDVGIKGTPNVNVTNASIPVTGSVGITGTPNVNVTNASIPVTGTVGISGTPNVNVTNIPSSPLYIKTITTNLTPGSESHGSAEPYVVGPLDVSSCQSIRVLVRAPSTGQNHVPVLVRDTETGGLLYECELEWNVNDTCTTEISTPGTSIYVNIGSTDPNNYYDTAVYCR